MFDIVIPIGTGSIWKNNEIRYCLRSIEKFCSDFGQIVIVGEKPEWLTNVLHIPFTETGKHELNIWQKIVHICERSEVSEDFLFCNDDFFFLKPFSANYPNYHAGTLAEYIARNRDVHYFQVVKKTMNLLLSHNLPTLHFDIHRPIVFNKAKFLEVFNFFNPQDELIMKSCYANYHHLEGEFAKDLKIGRKYIDQLEKHLQDSEIFSIYDSLCGPELFNFLNRRFSKKSKYEL